LAGNVRAVVVDDELRILGDGAANWVEVRQIAGNDASGRTFVIEGKPFNGNFNAAGDPVQGSSPTFVNGSLQSAVLFTRKDALRIFLGDGNDAVEVGTDASDATVTGLLVNTGAARDFVSLERVTHNPAVTPLTIRTGGELEAAGETVRLENVFVPVVGLNIATGGGNDRLHMNNVRVGGHTEVKLGGGADSLNGTGLNFTSADFNAGGTFHRDLITFSEMTVETLFVGLGQGDDRVWFQQNVRVNNKGTMNGGDGSDTLIIGQNVGIQDLSRVSMENTIIV
jgi:hypothetical protein